jgi:hypothetical protein
MLRSKRCQHLSDQAFRKLFLSISNIIAQACWAMTWVDRPHFSGHPRNLVVTSLLLLRRPLDLDLRRLHGVKHRHLRSDLEVP